MPQQRCNCRCCVGKIPNFNMLHANVCPSLLLSLSLFLLLPLTATFSNLQLNYDQRRRPNQVGEQARLSLIPGCRVRSARECVVAVGDGKFVLSRSLLVSLSLSLLLLLGGTIPILQCDTVHIRSSHNASVQSVRGGATVRT